MESPPALPAPAEQGSDSRPAPGPTWGSHRDDWLSSRQSYPGPREAAALTDPASDLPPAEVRPQEPCPAVRPLLPAASEERSEPCSVADTPAKSAHGDTYVCGVLIHNLLLLKRI